MLRYIRFISLPTQTVTQQLDVKFRSFDSTVALGSEQPPTLASSCSRVYDRVTSRQTSDTNILSTRHQLSPTGSNNRLDDDEACAS